MYGTYDQRGLRIPRNQSYGQNMQQNTATNSGGGLMNNSNQYGAYSRNQTNDIGTTRTEQTMQGGMGGLSTAMNADHNTPGSYGQGGSQYGMTSQYGSGTNNQYGMNTQYGANNQYGMNNRYGSQMNQQSNQFGAYGQNQTNDIGTTRIEQSMRGGMGGLSTAMNADHNTPGSYGQGGSQYGMTSQYGSGTNNQYGMNNQYGSQMNQQSNQFGAYGQNQTNDIGTTRIEQSMRGGMGGLSTAMNADHNTPGSYGQGGSQYGMTSQYGSGTNNQYGMNTQSSTNNNQYGMNNQYGSQMNQQSNQFGAYGQNQTNDIGTTRIEQSMRGGMGGLSTAMNADHNTQGSYGQGGSQYGMTSQYGSGTNNQYGMNTQYGSQMNQQSNQFGAYSQNQTNDIGITRTEQSMRGGMGGLSTAMNADHNTPGSYGQGGSQYGMTSHGNQYGMSTQYGANNQYGMNTQYGSGNQYGMNTQYGGGQSNTGQYGYGSQYGTQSNMGGNQVNNPGDTPLEQRAKQQLGVSGNQF